MSTGALINSTIGGAAEFLDEDEFACLAGILRLYRERDKTEHGFESLESRVIDTLRRCGEAGEACGIDRIVVDILQNLQDEEPQEVGAIMADGLVCIPLKPGMMKTLSNVISVVTREGWLGDFITTWSEVLAEPRRDYPTPLEAIQHLVGTADEFDSSIETTKQMLRMFSRLFEPAQPAKSDRAATRTQ